MPPKRSRPRDLGENWPKVPIADPIGEVARRFALALQAAIGDRSLREIERLARVDDTSIADLLRGDSWPDMITIVRLEIGLGVPLWPSGHLHDGVDPQ